MMQSQATVGDWQALYKVCICIVTMMSDELCICIVTMMSDELCICIVTMMSDELAHLKID